MINNWIIRGIKVTSGTAVELTAAADKRQTECCRDWWWMMSNEAGQAAECC